VTEIDIEDPYMLDKLDSTQNKDNKLCICGSPENSDGKSDCKICSSNSNVKHKNFLNSYGATTSNKKTITNFNAILYNNYDITPNKGVPNFNTPGLMRYGQNYGSAGDNQINNAK